VGGCLEKCKISNVPLVNVVFFLMMVWLGWLPKVLQ